MNRQPNQKIFGLPVLHHQQNRIHFAGEDGGIAHTHDRRGIEGEKAYITVERAVVTPLHSAFFQGVDTLLGAGSCQNPQRCAVGKLGGEIGEDGVA